MPCICPLGAVARDCYAHGDNASDQWIDDDVGPGLPTRVAQHPTPPGNERVVHHAPSERIHRLEEIAALRIAIEPGEEVSIRVFNKAAGKLRYDASLANPTDRTLDVMVLEADGRTPFVHGALRGSLATCICQSGRTARDCPRHGCSCKGADARGCPVHHKAMARLAEESAETRGRS